MDNDMSWAIVGLGRAGCSLARAMLDKGININVGVVRTVESKAVKQQELPFAVSTDLSVVADVDILLIAVPDTETAGVAVEIARVEPRCAVALHISAVHPAALLRPLGDAGAAIGSCHPLLTLTGKRVSFSNSYFAVEGDPEAVQCAGQLVAALGGITVDLAPGSKPLYHAGAVVACNYVVTLIACALQLFRRAEIESDIGAQMLLPLLRQTIDNVQSLGVLQALTGPIARGDMESVQLHMEAIKSAGMVKYGELYKVLGMLTAELAKSGERISDQDYQRLLKFLGEYDINR